MSKIFKIKGHFKPAGDQPKAIKELVRGLGKGHRFQTLLGATGTGKTFTVANVIAEHNKPTLVIAHNKTLAAQLASEFKEFFPDHAVHYFVSYYDFYQPEAYLPTSDTYIEKDAQINKEIDRLRHATTQSLLTRKDVIIVASVSCIYGLGNPDEYEKVNLKISVGEKVERTVLMQKLIKIYFERTNADLSPGQFRSIGNKVEIMPISESFMFSIVITGGVVESVRKVDPVSSKIISEEKNVFFFPAKHFITPGESKDRAVKLIKEELKQQLKKFEKEGKLLEAERIKRRTTYDLAMIREVGYCSGIENYSRHLSGKTAGEPPDTLLSYFPHAKDGSPEFLTVIDESHVTIPQIGGMYGGDASRKNNLVEFGFRLPSAKDNRPLRFEEFKERVGQVIFTSATPATFEKENSAQVVEQIIRPTGLIDPVVLIRPILEKEKYEGQVQDFINEAVSEIKKGGRVLATTLTKKMAEELSAYLKDKGIKSEYLHSDVQTLDRIRILTRLRKGEFDCLVGVNLLREGLDLPEVSLIGILDADKEGFLRSEVALIQTIGRAARNINGRVILYADHITGSMERAIGETERRRKIQLDYNKKNNITPKTIQKKIQDITEEMENVHDLAVSSELEIDLKVLEDMETLKKKGKGGKRSPIDKLIKLKDAQMREAVKSLDFETAAILRDEIKVLAEKYLKQE